MEPNPSNVAPWYLRDLCQALELDPVTGNVFMRTGINGNVNISGPVTIPGTVNVASTPGDPVHTHVSEVGTSGILTVPFMPIGGTVSVNALPAITGNVNAVVSGTVAVSSLPAITGNVNANVSGNVGVTGNVAVTSLPNISGNVAVTSMPAITGNVGVTSLPNISGNVAITSMPNIAGNVAVTALPNISGNVAVTSMPNIAGNVNANVTGNVAVTALPNISGNVNANVSGNVGIIGNVNVTQGTTPWSVTGNVSGNTTASFAPGSTDAFGRLRVSEPYTLFDTRARYYDHNQFSSSVVNGGTVTHVSSQSSYDLSITAAANSSVIRESKRVFIYQPGKSQLTLNTFCMATPQANLRQRVGLFGANDGVFFENDGNFNYMVIRTSSFGGITEERVRQDAWNGDQLNSAVVTPTCPSGQILYPNRAQIFYADVEWLGVGSVRTGFVINGEYILCHTFHHANQPGFDRVYMTTATLPIRYEITATAALGSAATMKQICSSVISEGGFQERSTTQGAGTGINPFRLTNGGSYYPVVNIRLASSRLDAVVVPTQVDILSPSVNYYRWALLLNPTLTGATWAVTSPTGTVEIDYGSRVNPVTGGIELQTGFASSREMSTLGELDFNFQLGRSLAGVSDIVTLAIASVSNNADVMAELGWQELT